jgi:hypothetical protein
MIPERRSQPLRLLTALLVCLRFAGAGLGRAADPPARGAVVQPAAGSFANLPDGTQLGKAPRVARAAPPSSPANLPDDVQLINADTNPTLRFPVGHSSLSWTLLKPRIRASYGWLEISRDAIRYTMVRQSRITKETDAGFEVGRTEIVDPKIEYGATEFRALKLRHFFGYAAENHWDAADSTDASVNSVAKADSLYTPLILRALQNFDGVVADFKLKQQAAVPPAVVVQPAVTPPSEPKTVPPPSPPTVVLVAPSGAGENQTVQVNESPLTVRGMAMDNSGFPTVTINGAPAVLRPKSAQAAEFWSDPVALKPGDNTFEIVATNSAQAKSKFSFVAHFTPKTAPPNPRALGKQDIISLLQGGVPNSRIVELVKDRGLKFSPTADDLDGIRAAGGNEEVIQAIQQAAAPVR